MSYNPGIAYKGDQYLSQGISSATQALIEGFGQYQQNKKDSRAADVTFDTMVPFLSKAGVPVDPDLLGKFHTMPLKQKQAALGAMTTQYTMTRQDQDYAMRQEAAQREQQRLDMETVNNKGAADLRAFQLKEAQADAASDDELGKILGNFAPGGADGGGPAPLANPDTGPAAPAPLANADAAPGQPEPGAVDMETDRPAYGPMAAAPALPYTNQDEVGAAAAGPVSPLTAFAPAAKAAATPTAPAAAPQMDMFTRIGRLNDPSVSGKTKLKMVGLMQRFSGGQTMIEPNSGAIIVTGPTGVPKVVGNIHSANPPTTPPPEGYTHVFNPSSGKWEVRIDRTKPEVVANEPWIISEDVKVFNQGLAALPKEQIKQVLQRRIEWYKANGRFDPMGAKVAAILGDKKTAAEPEAAPTPAPSAAVRKYNPASGRIE